MWSSIGVSQSVSHFQYQRYRCQPNVCNRHIFARNGRKRCNYKFALAGAPKACSAPPSSAAQEMFAVRQRRQQEGEDDAQRGPQAQEGERQAGRVHL